VAVLKQGWGTWAFSSWIFTAVNDQETKLNERAKFPMKNIWLDCDPVIIIQMNREPNKQYIIGPRRRDSHPARRVRIQRKFTGNIDCSRK